MIELIEKEQIRTEESQISNEAQEAAELSRIGYQLLKHNKIDDAIECFTKILLIDGNNNYALVGLGDASRKKGAINDAIRYYQRCLEHHQINNYALFGLADCYRGMKQYQKAIDIWEKYMLHDDKNVTVLTRIADAYRKVRNFQKSKVTYEKVLYIENDNPYAIIGLGHLHYDFKDYKAALLYWEKMLNEGFSNVDIRILTSIGNCHRKLRTFAKGIPYFEAALKKEKNNFYALFGIADCCRATNQLEESLEYWNKILQMDPKNKMILTRTGDAYRNLGMYDKAKELYERALDIDFDTYAVMGLALIAKEQGKYEESIVSFKRLIQQDNVSSRPYLELADCFLKMGDKTKAAETMDAMQKTRNSNVKISGLYESV